MRNDLHKRYAIIVAYVPSIERDKIELEINKFKELVTSMEGRIEKHEYLGLKKLAYKIKKYESAHYVQYYIKFEANKHLKKYLFDLNRKISPTLNLNTLRHMIMKIEHQDFNFNILKNYEGFENSLKI